MPITFEDAYFGSFYAYAFLENFMEFVEFAAKVIDDLCRRGLPYGLRIVITYSC